MDVPLSTEGTALAHSSAFTQTLSSQAPYQHQNTPDCNHFGLETRNVSMPRSLSSINLTFGDTVSVLTGLTGFILYNIQPHG